MWREQFRFNAMRRQEDQEAQISRRSKVFYGVCLVLALGMTSECTWTEIQHAQAAPRELSSSELADELLKVLYKVYPLEDSRRAVDSVKELIMSGIKTQWTSGFIPIDTVGATLKRSRRGRLFKLSYQQWNTLPYQRSKRSAQELSAAKIQRYSRRLLKRSAQSEKLLKKIARLGLSSSKSKPKSSFGLLEGSYALGLENLARGPRRLSSSSRRGRKALREMIKLFDDAQRYLDRNRERGRVVLGEHYLLIQIGLAIGHLKLNQHALALKALTRFFTIPSPAESLLDLRAVLRPKIESAKALAFDLHNRQRGARLGGRWVNGFASLADELNRWLNALRAERKRLRELKGKTRDLIQRTSITAKWWKKRSREIRARLRTSEAAIALQQLTVGLASTVRDRQKGARRSTDIEWIQIPEGSLWVAHPRDPSQSVEVKFDRPFFISKTEVTVALYQQCVN
jgi:hypothetical protein